MLPWKWAVKKVKMLTDSREYWMVTVRPDGRPHAMIIWGIWFDGAFWFGTGSKTQKARNLSKNPKGAALLDFLIPMKFRASSLVRGRLRLSFFS